MATLRERSTDICTAEIHPSFVAWHIWNVGILPADATQCNPDLPLTKALSPSNSIYRLLRILV